MTLNDLEWLFRVKFGFRAGLAGSDRATFGQETASAILLRNRASLSAMFFFVTFYRRNDLQLRIITTEAYVG